MYENLHARIARKGSSKEQIAKDIIADPELLPGLFEGLKAGKGKASVKFGCNKVLMILSEKKPSLLYPYFDQFVGMLDWDNKFLKWGALRIVANLCTVDRDGKFDTIFGKYYSFITGSVMVSAANVIGGSAMIAQAKPKLADKIACEILKVEKAKYETAECRKVAIGHAIEAFASFFDLLEAKEPVVKFVRRQLKISRQSVAKNAAEFLKKYDPKHAQ